MTTSPAPARYLEPSRGDRFFNDVVAWCTRRGLSIFGSRVLTVTGRKSGVPRSNPVNLLVVDGERYLVAPRGVTEWVRNVRVAGHAQLSVGRRVEEVTAVEVPVAERVPVIRLYLERWAWEVGRFFEGVDARSDDATIAAVADGFPVFRLSPKA